MDIVNHPSASDENFDVFEIHEEHENDEVPDDSHEEQVEEIKLRVRESLAKLENKICERIAYDKNGYEKALKIFEKHVENLSKTNDSAIQNSLCKFAETSTPALSVMQRKKGKYINIQTTSKSRRTFRLRGSRSAYFGAPTKVQKKKIQMIVTETNEVFGHKLPGKSKKKKKNNPHNLMASVVAVRSAERKH